MTEDRLPLAELLAKAGEGSAGRPDEAKLVYRPAVPDLWRVPDALARIRAALAEHPEGGDLASFLPPIPPDDAQRPVTARAAVASTFVAGLGMARAGVVEAAQDGAFGIIRLRVMSDATG